MKPQWEQAADAVVALGRPASVDDVWRQLQKVRRDIPRSTVADDLRACAVNSPSRTSYAHGKEPRRTDTGNPYDRLFNIGERGHPLYVGYDPAKHGVWEIFKDSLSRSSNGTSIRRLSAPSSTSSKQQQVHADSIPEISMSSQKSVPINRILFGPPGTGKTYRTIDEALSILDPAHLAQNGDDRAALKQRFDELVAARRIRFVTFHQSFSYEDFVEGIRADTESGQVQYRVEPGIFRIVCERASGSVQVGEDIGVRDGARIWKLSIDRTGENATHDYCFKHGEARIGWGEVGDLADERLTEKPEFLALGPNDRNTLLAFSREAQIGDVLLCIGSETSVQGISVVDGDYQYRANTPPGTRETYQNVLPVRWLATGLSLDIREINDGVRFSQKTMYEIDRFGWSELSEFLEAKGITLDGNSGVAHPQPLPHVLIIDEINRGNISRIFGELITLIEPSKRKGMPEALEVVLPYSRKRFSVPANLHLIGTMNTADRSLAGLDIALRRRFEFVEMLPDLALLANIKVEGIAIDCLLAAMNERIEALLGRDYMLGHAYFLRLRQEGTLAALADIFKRQVLPLLQEYFFEDWQKIALVLNDQRKKNAALQFLQKREASEGLFGPDVDLPRDAHLWSINAKAFENPEAYKATIQASVAG